MPLYEYECEACSHRFERIQKFSDPPVETCPTCGSKVRKLLSSPAIQFKGSGWYITDYARSGKSESEASSAGKSEGKSDDKGEKADAKTESKSESTAQTKSESKSDSKSDGKSDGKPSSPATS